MDGVFNTTLSCLEVLFPKVSWLPLAERNNMLLQGVGNTALPVAMAMAMETHFTSLEAILRHTFAHRALVFEAFTFISPVHSWQSVILATRIHG